jgi:hypothetical protein
MGPQTIPELQMTLCILSAGIFMTSKIFGDLAVLMECHYRSKSMRQEQIDSMNEVMDNINLSNNEQQ